MKVLWQWRNDDVMRRETGIGQLIALRDVLWNVLQGWQNNVIQERKQASARDRVRRSVGIFQVVTLRRNMLRVVIYTLL